VGRSGTSFPFGCKRTSGTGSLTAEPVIHGVPRDRLPQIFLTGGFLLKYSFGARLELGGEVFSHGREGFAAGATEASTMIDVGGYYHFKHHPVNSFLFCYGHSVAGQTENYAYVGMYWTWGGTGINRTPDWLSSVVHLNDKAATNSSPKAPVFGSASTKLRATEGRPAAGVAIAPVAADGRALLTSAAP